MRIAYASNYDPRDIRSWSGTGYHIPHALQQHGLEIEFLGPLDRQNNPLNIARYLFHQKLRGRNDHPQRDPGFLRSYARQIESKLAATDADILFGPGGLSLTYVETDLPIVIWTDCTFRSMTDYYAKYTNMSKRTVRNGEAAERRVLERCALVVMSSQWAADSAINDYGVDPARVRIAPFGANLPCDRTEDDIVRIAEERPMDRCRLLFVGVDWERKGGPLTVAVTKELNRRGLPTELTIVGCDPPLDDEVREHVHLLGFVNKSSEEGLAQFDKLFRASHFFVLPTQAEAFGIVFCEASSYGVPSVATRTGGVPSVVTDDVNGRLFDLDEPAAHYADWIETLYRDPAAYRALALSSFAEYRDRINWKSASALVVDAMKELARPGD